MNPSEERIEKLAANIVAPINAFLKFGHDHTKVSVLILLAIGGLTILISILKRRK